MQFGKHCAGFFSGIFKNQASTCAVTHNVKHISLKTLFSGVMVKMSRGYRNASVMKVFRWYCVFSGLVV